MKHGVDPSFECNPGVVRQDRCRTRLVEFMHLQPQTRSDQMVFEIRLAGPAREIETRLAGAAFAQ